MSVRIPLPALLLFAVSAFADDAVTHAQPGAEPAPSPTAAHAPARADFVGTVRYALTIQGQAATASYMRTAGGDTVVDIAVRDTRIKQTMRTSVVVLSGNPDEAWQIMHQTRTFSRVALAVTDAADESRFTVENGESTTIVGHAVKQVTVTDTMSGDVLTVWLDPTFGNIDMLDRLYRGYQPQAPSIAPLLARQGHVGLPLRFSFLKKSAGQTVEGTATAIDAGAVDDDALSPPRGFIRVELPAGSGPIPFLSGPPSAKDVHSVIRSFVGQ
jgi:hypothetical protein